MADLGRMDDQEQYARYIAAGPNGKLYLAIGFAHQDVVSYDIASGQHQSLFPSDWRTPGCPSVTQGSDGNVYVIVKDQVTGKTKGTYRIDNGKLTQVDKFPVKMPALSDGRTVLNIQSAPDTSSFDLQDPKSGKTQTVKFQQQYAGSNVFMVAMGPDGNVYGSSDLPLAVFRYVVSSGKTEYYGEMAGSQVYSMLPYKGKIYMGSYPEAVLALFDPAGPAWRPGSDSGSNPTVFGPLGDGDYRPRSMVLAPDGLIYIGNFPPYGQLGGALAVWDPQQNKVVGNYRNIVREQSIASLTYEPRSGLIFGGTNILGGTGIQPTQAQAAVFAFDPKTKQKTLETQLAPKAKTYQAIAAANGKLFVASGSVIYVYDPVAGQSAGRIRLPSPQIEVSLEPYNGKLYGITTTSVYSVDPRSLRITVLGAAPVKIERGFAVCPSGIYFANQSHLWRYSFH